jgi:hypothetical protein
MCVGLGLVIFLFCTAPAFAQNDKGAEARAQAVGTTVTPKTSLDARPPAEPKAIVAPAPRDLGHHHLGRAVDATFRVVPGSKPLFSGENRKQHREVINRWQSRYEVIEDAAKLAAFARAWAIAGAIETAATTRYAVYRAIQLNEFHEVDDTRPMAAPPASAAYYISKIWYGRSYEVRVWGDSNSFSASAKAEFLSFGGGAEGFARRFRLSMDREAVGLKPKTGVLFARSEDDVRSAYAQDPDAGKPVPVLVEYTPIPGAKIPAPEVFEWKTAPAPAAGQVRHVRLSIIGKNDEWAGSGLHVDREDVILVRASGKIALGGWGGSATPDTSGNGGLDMKVGRSFTTRAGARFFWVASEAGEVKFRVRDSKYSDNAGGYDVDVVIVPKEAVPAAEPIAPRD